MEPDSTKPPSDMQPSPLPMVAIIKTASVLPWIHRTVLLKAILPLVVVKIMLIALVFSGDALGIFGQLLFLIHFPLVLAAGVYALVRFHRVFVLDNARAALDAKKLWSYQEWRFLGWGIVILLISILLYAVADAVASYFNDTSILNHPENVSEAVSFESWLLSTAFELPALFFITQLLLIFPASALGESCNPEWSWATTKGNRLRVFVVLGLVPMIVGLIPASISLITDVVPRGGWIAVTILMIGITLYLFAFEVALLSRCYRFFTLGPEQERSTPGYSFEA